MRGVFAEPFSVRWTFDVEILARLALLAKTGKIAPLDQAALEHPLTQWRDVSGSKLGPGAALRAGAELASLWARYHRQQR
jgi:hypothetical protein